MQSFALQRCGIDEIKAFQTVLNGYQIHVLSKEHFNAVIYKGPNAEKKIYLYYHDGHFDVITKMIFACSTKRVLYTGELSCVAYYSPIGCNSEICNKCSM
jgi:hypothetical protein